jgi:hypothetical protein
VSSIITSAKATEAAAENAITASPSRTPWRTRRDGVVGVALGWTVVATVVADTAGIDLDPLLGASRVLLGTGW